MSPNAPDKVAKGKLEVLTRMFIDVIRGLDTAPVRR